MYTIHYISRVFLLSKHSDEDNFIIIIYNIIYIYFIIQNYIKTFPKNVSSPAKKRKKIVITIFFLLKNILLGFHD